MSPSAYPFLLLPSTDGFEDADIVPQAQKRNKRSSRPVRTAANPLFRPLAGVVVTASITPETRKEKRGTNFVALYIVRTRAREEHALGRIVKHKSSNDSHEVVYEIGLKNLSNRLELCTFNRN